MRDELLSAARRYCDDTGLALATVATRVANDSRFFERMAAGGDCTTRKYERFMAFFAAARRAKKPSLVDRWFRRHEATVARAGRAGESDKAASDGGGS